MAFKVEEAMKSSIGTLLVPRVDATSTLFNSTVTGSHVRENPSNSLEKRPG